MVKAEPTNKSHSRHRH